MRKKLLSTMAQCAMATALLLTISEKASAATGDLGTGVPVYGVYSEVLGGVTRIWQLLTPTINFPAACPSLVLSRATMGADDYKIAQAMLLTAKMANKRVRFYAHADRDGGCGVDYVQLAD